MDPLNVFQITVPEASHDDRPEGFRSDHLQIGPLLGACRMGATLYALPRGQRIGPYHYEYNNEEWLLVLAGHPTLRTPNGDRVLSPGDLVAFPEGREGAHDISNASNESVRVLILSTKRNPAVAVYPDSDKIAIWRLEGGDADGIMVKRSAAAGYWEDEAPGCGH